MLNKIDSFRLNYWSLPVEKTFPFVLLISLFLCTSLFSAVTFVQTTDTDFNLGFHDNAFVSGGDVYLPNKATSINNWLTTTVLPQQLTGHKMATWKNSYVFLTGGYNGTACTNAVYKATLQSAGISSWTSLNALPLALRDHAVVIGINFIYVLGGRTDSGSPIDAIYYASINSDGTIGSWQVSSVSLPQAIWGHTAHYVNGYIYVVGGTNLTNEATAIDSVYYANVYPNGNLSEFSATSSLPQTRNGHTMVTYDSKLFVIGGYDSTGTKDDSVYFAETNINGTLDAWQTCNSLPIAMSNHSSTCFNGIITAIGGDTTSTRQTNIVYYADVDDAPNFNWILSPYLMYDRSEDGQAFAANGQIVFAGGTNLSGAPIHNTRYALLTMGSDVVNKAGFVSYPFFELGDERDIESLMYNISYNPTFSNYEILYRLAGNDEIWSDWTNANQDNPVIIGQHKRYVQYMFRFSTTNTYNINLHDITVYITGTELSGNLNSIDTLFYANSPYWATANIEFTAGTHTIEPGVTIIFSPYTGLEIGQANVLFNGTATDSILLTYYTDESGSWTGVYFNDNSDNGVSSQILHTIIEKAGYGSNNANLRCYNTNEPLIKHSTFREAVGFGISLTNSDIIIEESNIENNLEDGGLYAENSNPSLLWVNISNNAGAGVYLTSAISDPKFYSCNIDSNYYAIYYATPNNSIYPPDGSVSLTNNTYNGIVIAGGTVSSDIHWTTIPYDYFIVGDVTIAKSQNTCRLTIEPGNTVKVDSGYQIQVGKSGYGGELYAVGSADSLITFTSFNGSSGDWNGIYFHSYSDEYGSESALNHCLIENGNEYNIYCENTNQPATIYNCQIRNSAGKGIYLSNSMPSLSNLQILNNSDYGLYCNNAHYVPEVSNLNISGNSLDGIVIAGGIISTDRTWSYCGADYVILGDLFVEKNNSKCRLTIEKGNTLKFANNVEVHFSDSYNDGGELYAEGTADSVIIFTSLNDSIGGWDGIYFDDGSDYYAGQTSSLKHCVIEKGNEYNVYCYNTNQPTMNNCNIRNSAGKGIYLNSSNITIDNSTIELNGTKGIYCYNSMPLLSNLEILNNNDYGLYCNNANYVPEVSNLNFTGNSLDGIVIAGGTISADRTWFYCGADYVILGDITIMEYHNNPNLAIDPGNTIKFAENVKLQIGASSSYGGKLYAEGTVDSFITFTSLNDSIGGWNGLYFNDGSDSYGSTSSLKHCVIEKGNENNVYCYSTNQPTFDHTIIMDSDGYGLSCYSSSPQIKVSQIVNNDSFGIYISGSNCPVIGDTLGLTCDLWGNGDYDIYNNTSYNIGARHNFWDSTDAGYIASRIYDFYDDPAKGVVNFQPFADSSLFDNQPPYNFSLLTLANNTATSDQTPTFTWEQATDPNGDLLHYYFYYTEDSTWASSIVSSPLSDTTYTIPITLTGGKWYWWKVKAKDAYLSTYSNEIWKFGVSLPPTIPDPILPLPGDLMTAEDYLVWLESSDPDNGDVISHYHIQIDDSTDFSSPEIDMNGIGMDKNFNRKLTRMNANRELTLMNTNKLKDISDNWRLPCEIIGTKDSRLVNRQNISQGELAVPKDNAYAIKINELTNYDSLSDNTYYYWRVSAVDGFGIEGDFSDGTDNFIYFASGVELGTVQGLTIQISASSAELNWDSMTQDIHGNPVTISHYNIYRSEEPYFTPGAMEYLGNTNLTTYTDTNALNDGFNYFYVVTAVVGLDNFNRDVGTDVKVKELPSAVFPRMR